MSSTDSFSKPRLPIRWVQAAQNQGTAPVLEDCFSVNPDRGIFLLADGFGGAPGKSAADLVVKSVQQFLEQEAGDLDATLPFELRPYYSLAGNVLFNAVTFANQKLSLQNKGSSWLESGGASLIAGYLEGNLLALANVGGCSVFLERQGRIKELVSPKTLGRQTNPFEIDAPRGETVIPLMSFGTVKQLEPEITEIELKSGDQVLFQTASVNTELREQLLQLKHSTRLSQLVDEYSGEANLSVICLSF